MGWTYTHRERGMKDVEFFERELFGWEDDLRKCELLDCHRASMRHSFVKCRITRKQTGEVDVFAAVVLTQWDHSHEYNFGYKVVEESMGPYEVDCPLRIIEGLSPTCGGENDYAARWREDVRQWNANKSPSLKVGDRFKLETPLRFTDGHERDTFTVVRYGKRGRAYQDENGRLVRISGLNKRRYHKIAS